PCSGMPLDLRRYAGIVAYEPAELAVTVRVGTALATLEETLRRERQMLAFEPPHFGRDATVGGCVATGLSGPGRPWRASVRDHVLGISCVTGAGEYLHFGGRVIKNVAGFDVSRLMVGAFGRLGILVDVTLRTVPLPQCSRTQVFEEPGNGLLERLRALAAGPSVSAAAAIEGRIFVRLSGSERAVQEQARRLGGEATTEDFWDRLREQQHPFFAADARPLWRLSCAPAAPLALAGDWLLDWGGAQRWLRSDQAADTIRTEVRRVGGHATLFRDGRAGVPVFQPLPAGLDALEERLRRAFDPEQILNRVASPQRT
ncbi:MAG TPA: glycolate oxidase subunit GlcE, partial [Acidiferrobacteraceae bacterium]|nr:glycolate oxidase subunit GlcE [Acidiferrobacteraceae bacterium]